MPRLFPIPSRRARQLLLSGLLPSLLWAADAAPPPILASGEWVAVAGESPASLARLLFPAQPVTQQRFIAALAAENPALGIDAGGAPFVPGSVLKMPDWRQLGAGERRTAPAPRQAAVAEMPPRAAVPAVPAAPPPLSWMRLSTTLAPGPVADELTRQTLRLEYRLLSLLSEQLLALGGGNARAIESAVAGSVATGDARTPPLRLQTDATATLPAPAPEPAPVPAPAPVAQPPVVVPLPAPPAIPQPAVAAPSPPVLEVAPPPKHLRQSPPESDAGHGGLPYYAGGGLLLLAALYLRRRRKPQRPPEVPLEHAETVVMEHPSPPAARSAPVLDVVDAIPSAPLSVATRLPEAPDPGDVNPVLELAEIMLSFGRVQGAAETLREYIEANPREALQPWIKLLDIYRQGDMPEEFAALAERLNQHFNVEIQQWDGRPPPPKRENVVRVATLEALPHVCERIVALWGKPECSDYLRQLLRDNRDGERGGFTLPVVQEILLLIDLLAGREAAA